MTGNPDAAQAVYTTVTSIYQADTWDEGADAPPPGRWAPDEATQLINACAKLEDFDVVYTLEIGDAMKAQGLITGDVLHLLKCGVVTDEPVPSTRDGYFKYKIEGSTPNSEGKTIAAVVIPRGDHKIKIASVQGGDTGVEASL